MFLDYLQPIALYYCTSYTGSDTNHNPMAPHRNRVQVQQFSVPFAVCYAALRTVPGNAALLCCLCGNNTLIGPVLFSLRLTVIERSL